jgi:hypothetical protein
MMDHTKSIEFAIKVVSAAATAAGWIGLISGLLAYLGTGIVWLAIAIIFSGWTAAFLVAIYAIITVKRIVERREIVVKRNGKQGGLAPPLPHPERWGRGGVNRRYKSGQETIGRWFLQ